VKPLLWNQRRMTRIEVENEIRRRGHPMPEDWNKEEVTSGIGIFNTKENILTYWLVGAGDDYGGR
jgi:hypothetical protein